MHDTNATLEPIEAECLTKITGVRHGFFTRTGGTSHGIYKDLNCGFGSNDTREAVAANRSRVARHLNARANNVVTIYQVHSGKALTLQKSPDPENLPKADALVTTTPGLVIGVLTADCAPVLFADAENGVIAAAHAGWRGAVGGILEATVTEMEAAGANRAMINAAVGPCIEQKNYEVGHDFQDELVALAPDNRRFFAIPESETKPHFDLPGYVTAKLHALGIGTASTVGTCTYENDSLFFSYRRSQHQKEADYGRQISAIVLD